MIYNLIVYDNDKNVTDIVTFSSVLSFNEQYQSEVTENIVEYGFKISDHIITKSVDISCDAMVSDYSIYDDGLELYWDGEKFTNSNAVNGQQSTGKNLTVKQALIDIVQKRKLFTLIITDTVSQGVGLEDTASSLKERAVQSFNNCVMPTLGFPVKEGTYGVLFASFSIKQVRVAKTVTSSIDKNSIPLVEPIRQQSTNPDSKKDANGNDIGDKDGADSESKRKYGDNKEICQVINDRKKAFIKKITSDSFDLREEAKSDLGSINADTERFGCWGNN
jgi:hypothetical protein